MGVSLCARCDEMDLLQEAIVNLAVRDEHGARSGPGLIRNAIYKWDERAASVAFTQLRDALRAPDGPTTSPPPPVQLRLVLGQYLEDDHDAMCPRDLQTLLVRAREPTHDYAHRFRITRLIPQGRTTDITRCHCPAILTIIVNSGIVMQLKPLPSDQVPGKERSPWQWLFDWAEASREAPRLDELVIAPFGGQTTDTLVKLLDLVVTKSAMLQRLTLYWPLNSVDLDAKQRCRAVEAIGAVIFAPRSPVRLNTLVIDLGDLTDDNAGALVRGVAILPVYSNEGESSATVCFNSMKWAPQATSEACIGQVVRLFGAVGVRQLEMNSGFRGLDSKMLKAALQSCPQLTKLEWWELLCDDFSELEDATWPSSSGELRALRLSVSHDNDSTVLMAMDALLTRVGSQLTSLTLSALRSALSGPMADVIVARCPRLRHLDVMNANAHFHEELVEAFDADRCGATSLTVQSAWGSQGNDCGLLLASLKDPTRGASRRLRTFTLGEAWTSIDNR